LEGGDALFACGEVFHVDDVDLGDFACDEPVDVGGCEFFDVFVGWFVAEVCMEGVVGESGELEGIGAFFADHFKDGVVVGLCSKVFDGGAGDGAVVWSAKSAVRGDDECELGCIWVWFFEQGVALPDACIAEFGDESEDGFGVRARGDGGRLCAREFGCGNHLHRARNALDVIDSVHAFLDVLCVSHGSRW